MAEKESYELSGVLALFEELYRNKFYGEVRFQLKEGRIFLIRKEETIKPDSLPQNGKTEGGKDE